MANLPDIVAKIRVDTSGLTTGFSKARSSVTAATSGIHGDLVNQRGRFTQAGSQIGSDTGKALGEGFTRDVNGKLRDSRGKFVAEGRAAGEGFANSASSGIQAAGGSNGFGTAAIASAFSVLKTAAIGAGIAIGTVGTLAVSTGIKTAASLQQATVAFTTLLGSGQKAQAFLSELKSFAASTPFEFEGLVDSSRMLLGVGQSAKNIIPILTALGNTSGALGLSQDKFQRVMIAVTQTMAKGKIQAEELMQITEAGIPIWKLLSQATGKTVPELQKLSSEGKLLADDVWPKVFAVMNKNYGGAMEAQSKTLIGVWSTLKDTVSMALADALEPVIPILSKLIPQAAKIAGEALGALPKAFSGAASGAKSFTDTYGPKFSGVISSARKTIAQLKTTFSDVFQDVQQILDRNKERIDSWVDKIAKGMEQAQSIVQNTVTVLKILWDNGGKEMLQAVIVVIDGIVKVIGGALKILDGIVKAWKAIFTGDWSALWDAVKQIWSGAWDALLGLVQIACGTIAAWLVGWITTLKSMFGEAATSWWETFRNFWNSVGNGLSTAFQWWLSLFTGVWSAIGEAVWKGVQAVGNYITNGLTGWKMLFQQAWDAIKTGVSAAWDAIKTFISGAVNGIKSVLGWFGGLGGMFSNWFQSVKNSITSKLNEAVSFVKDVPQKIKNALGDLSGLLSGAGRAVMQGFLNGITAVWNTIKEKVSGMSKWISDHKGPVDKDKKLLIPHGKALMRGLGRGIAEEWANVQATIGGITAAVPALAGIGTPTMAVSGPAGSLAPPTSNTFSPVINMRNGASAQDVMDEMSWTYRYKGARK